MHEIRVAIIDDDQLFRSGIKSALETATDISVVAEGGDGGEAQRIIQDYQPDVLLLDLSMPTVDGLTALRQMKPGTERCATIVITTFDFDQNIIEALSLGVSGFLVKGVGVTELVNAVRLASHGGVVLDPNVTARVAEVFVTHETRRSEAAQRLRSLPQREKRVLALLSDGLSNSQIAARLHLSQATVKSYVSSIMNKLNLENRVQIALLGREAGLSARDLV